MLAIARKPNQDTNYFIISVIFLNFIAYLDEFLQIKEYIVVIHVTCICSLSKSVSRAIKNLLIAVV